MLRSTFAVAGGYVAMAAAANLVMLLSFTMAAESARGGGEQPFLYTDGFGFNLVVRWLAAMLGGYLTATLAHRRQIAHGLALGAVILLVDLLVAAVIAPGQPAWYRPLLSGGGTAGFAVLGASLRARRRRSSDLLGVA